MRLRREVDDDADAVAVPVATAVPTARGLDPCAPCSDNNGDSGDDTTAPRLPDERREAIMLDLTAANWDLRLSILPV